MGNDAYLRPASCWLWIGAFVNVWCLVLCATCMWPLFITSEDSVKDVVFDALGLAFLYNLDDAAGDLGFLEHQWDEDQMGDIYGHLADERDIINKCEHDRTARLTADNIYDVGRLIMWV